jgi:hypothetical protein
MTGHDNQLAPPPNALNSSNSGEILRAWIVDGGLEVSLTRAFDQPDTWGLLLIDVARHGSRMFEHQGVCSEAEAMAAITKMMSAELARPTDLGTTSANIPKPN